MKQILFDETHDEAVSIADSDYGGFFKLASELAKLGYTVRKTEKSLSNELESTNVLVVAFPQREFRLDESEMINNFVTNGGGLLLLGEWANLHGVSDCLNTISKQFGVEFRNDRLTDFDDRYARYDEVMKGVLGVGEMPYLIKMVDFEEHPITEGIKSVSFLAGCTLDTDKEDALMWADETSFGDVRIDEFQQISERTGPFIVAAVKEVGKGRILGTGDSSTFSNRFIEKEDNRRLGVQIIQWLAGDR